MTKLITARLRRTTNLLDAAFGKVGLVPINPDGPEAADLIDAQDAKIKALVDALGKLSFEVAGLNAFEFEVRHAIGNTNFSCIMARLEKAKTALAAEKETT